MIARSERSYPRADPLRVTTAAALGVALVCLSWALLHTAWYDDTLIVDTPVYQSYGDAMTDGQVPYRDFELEYPPLALPVFLVPSLFDGDDYDQVFDFLMLACAAAAVVCVAAALGAVGSSAGELYGGVALAALSPLLLGSLVLSRYDFWPAALTAGALAALASARPRLGLLVLGAAVSAKLYPLVLLPIALLYVARRHGRREALAALAVFATVVVLIFLPFLLASPGGVVDSVTRQTGRPLQIESLGAGLLLAADRLGLYEATVVSSHGSQNLAGGLPDALATLTTVAQALAVIAIWVLFARSRRDSLRLFVASAAAVAAFVAFGKVLSPQFLVWLLPLVPLTLGAGLLPAGLLAAALVFTQLWFPSRYWDVVALDPVAWLVPVRDLLLVALTLALAVATARGRGARDSP